MTIKFKVIPGIILQAWMKVQPTGNENAKGVTKQENITWPISFTENPAISARDWGRVITDNESE